MMLRAKQGRNQKGFCFVSSEESNLQSGVFKLKSNERYLLADVRFSKQVPKGFLILDDRAFCELGCVDGSEVSLNPCSENIPTCSELQLSVFSTKGLDNSSVADAISKRVNDLQDDFEGLILRIGQNIVIERLGIVFKILNLSPKNDVLLVSRISWQHLKKIHLDPLVNLPLFNICYLVEIGASAHVADIKDGDEGNLLSRYQTALLAIDIVAKSYTGYGTQTHFCGFAYSDVVLRYPLYDSQTGESIPSSFVHSQSLLISFKEWLRDLVDSQKIKSSNPGEALRVAIEATKSFQNLNDYPTILIFCASGVHSVGANPVKVVKKALIDSNLKILSLGLGFDRSVDLMDAIAKLGNGMGLMVQNTGDIEQINTVLNLLISRGGHA